MHVTHSKVYSTALWLGFVLLLLVAGATAKIVPEFDSVFSKFGTDLPFLTRFVLKSPTFIWILPVLAASLIALSFRQKSSNWGALIVLVGLGVAWGPTAVYGLYLPVAHSAEATVDESADKSFGG
jgi:hypothetical protein